MQVSIVLIGGPCDGRRMEVNASTVQFRCPCGPGQYATYRRFWMSNFNEMRQVFVVKGTPEKQVIDLLLAGYRVPVGETAAS